MRFERRTSGLWAPAIVEGPGGKTTIACRQPAGQNLVRVRDELLGLDEGVVRQLPGQDLVRVRNEVLGLDEDSVRLVQGPGVAISFASQWSNGTGNSDAAVLDDGRWSVRNSVSPNVWEVRSTATDGRDYPTENYLRLTNNGAQAIVAFQSDDSYVSTPAVDGRVFWRWYTRLVSGTHANDHGDYADDDWITPPNWGPAAVGLNVDWSGPSGDMRVSSAQFLPGGGDNDDRYFVSPLSISKGTTYRYELMYWRETSATYRLAFRIYNLAGTLLVDENDFVGQDTPSLILGDVDHETEEANAGAASVRGFQIGDQSGSNTKEFAAFACSIEDWLGPYNEENEGGWTP